MSDPDAMASYFTSPDGDWLVPGDYCRGPWDARACHAGPPAAMIARAMERALLQAHSDHRLVRLTVNLTRPIPMAGFRVTAQIDRAGRSVTTLSAVLVDGSARQCSTAVGLAMRARPNQPLPSAASATPNLSDARSGRFPLGATAHGMTSFSDSVQIRYPPGQDGDPGPTTVWMRSAPLLTGEQPSALQKICPLADCGNALSRNASPSQVAFVNADLTIMLHREPAGEWLGSQSVSFWQSDGIGLADALLFDDQGPVGRALQSLLLTPAGD